MLAVDDIPCAMMLTDSEGHLLRLNRELLQIVGGQQADWIGQSMEVLLTPASRIFSQTHLFPLLHHDEVVREAYIQLLGRDRETVPVMVNATRRELDGADRIVWAVFVARERSRFEGQLIRARADAQSLAQQLRAREEEERQLVDSLSAGLVVHAPDGTVLRTNPRAQELLGLSAAEFAARGVDDPGWTVVYADGRPMDVADFPVSRVLTTGLAVSNVLLGVSRPDRSEPVWLLCRADPNRDADGRLRQIVVTFVDVTERQNALTLLQQSESRLQGIIGSAMDAIISTDASHRIVVFNAAAETMFGYTREQVLGQPVQMLLPAQLHAEYEQQIIGLARSGRFTRSASGQEQLHALRADGHQFPIEVAISQVTVQGQPTSTLILRDITARVEAQRALELSHHALEQANAQLADLAHFDALTGLPNRVLLADRLQQALLQGARRHRAVAVVFIDLDGFKQVNDRHGHAAGDALLVTLSQGLKAVLRDGDTLSRLGGDEFVAVLADLERPLDVEPVLRRLLEAVSQPVTLGDVRVNVSASLGVTIHPRDPSGPDQLIRHADKAMYQAKQAGKNRWHYFEP